MHDSSPAPPADSSALEATPPDPEADAPDAEEGATDAEAGAPDAASGAETPRQRFRRKAERVRLHANSVAVVALLAYLVALAALNTRSVKADWVFGTSHVALVWIVLFTAILGWLLGLLSIAKYHWRTRRPHS